MNQSGLLVAGIDTEGNDGGGAGISVGREAEGAGVATVCARPDLRVAETIEIGRWGVSAGVDMETPSLLLRFAFFL